MARTAIILGASGLIGSFLLEHLLEEEAYDKVIAYLRKPIESTHPKLEIRLRDLLDESAFEDAKCDDLYCCIGTTQAKTPDLSDYRKVDFGIPVNAAREALKQGMSRCTVVSSMGAKADSKTFYLRTKGQMEEALMKMGIPELHILRPSLLIGAREEFRFGERLFSFGMRAFKWIIPEKYRAIRGETVAKAMIELKGASDEKVLLESHDIRRLAGV